jgi:glycylpeptide N-tetradecanoyltransferase
MQQIKMMGGNPKDPKSKHAMEEFKKYKTLYDKHEFWDTQPVPKSSFLPQDEVEGEIQKGNIKDVPTEPYNLPPGYSWSDVDLNNEEHLDELYELLRDHYVEDSDHTFRFDYQKEFLKWALLPPKQHSDWLCGVRGGKKNKLFGFITGIPVKVRAKGKLIQMTEINFLCVHTKLRKLRLAPVLIKEITRRTNIKKIWQAIYTAGTLIPRPISEATYYHRDINVKKLLDIGFSYLPSGRSKSVHMKLLNVPKDQTIHNIRPMVLKDAKKVQSLLAAHLEKLDVSFHFNKEEVIHFLLPRDKVIYSYVVTDPETDEITDFISFYSLPSSVLNHEKYSTMYAAYSYYNVPGKHSALELTRNALILAKKNKFDVFNALDLMDNKEAFEELHFGKGSGNLYYYLYNWNLTKLQPKKLGVVLV